MYIREKRKLYNMDPANKCIQDVLRIFFDLINAHEEKDLIYKYITDPRPCGPAPEAACDCSDAAGRVAGDGTTMDSLTGSLTSDFSFVSFGATSLDCSSGGSFCWADSSSPEELSSSPSPSPSSESSS